MTSSTPGKTKLVNHFLINDEWYLVDLPGYGYAKMPLKEKEKLVAIIGDYLTYSEEMVMVFVLVDSRHDIQKIDLEFMDELRDNDIPFAIIFTKGDKLGPNVLKEQILSYKNRLLEYWEGLPECFTSSSSSGMGKEEILGYIGEILNEIKDLDK